MENNILISLTGCGICFVALFTHEGPDVDKIKYYFANEKYGPVIE